MIDKGTWLVVFEYWDDKDKVISEKHGFMTLTISVNPKEFENIIKENKKGINNFVITNMVKVGK